MFIKYRKVLSLPIFVLILVFYSRPAFTKDDVSLLEVTPTIRDYAINTVKPVLDSYSKKDKLSQFLKVSAVLIDPEIGIHTNEIKPSKYIIYDKLNKIKLGFFITLSLSSEQKIILKSWHSKYMKKNPADVFFAPSANEIIKTKAAFGCSHYARAFIAVVKALGLIGKPEDMRYVISCKADDYDKALKNSDKKVTINGHQFVMIKINSKWFAINTSKSEFTEMPGGFSPDIILPPDNIPVQFVSYPDITFLLRKAGKNYDDDCKDNTLSGLMNIYRSGNKDNSEFKWGKFFNINNKNT